MSRIKQFWQAQGRRRFLWGVLHVVLGMALYYALPLEPDWRALIALSALLLMLTMWRGGRHRGRWALLLLPVLGATWACAYTAMQHPIMLKRELSPRPIIGIVRDIERVETGLRITLAPSEIRGVEPEDMPKRIRLTTKVKPDVALPHIGDEIHIMAGLLPPMGAALPGGFDFARYFYFRGVGAVGYGLPPWKVSNPAAQSGFAQWRLDLTERIITKLGPERGPIAAGLITGEDRAITERDFEALRASNLYHIIAISGGHMVVIAGVIFVGLRLLLLLVPFGLTPQAKSLAAVLTLIMVTLYLFVTGMPISAVRAYVMIALVLLAVILRRDADAMRSLFLAALIMLLFDPSDLLEPGFQLSFVATLAIVALVESYWLKTSVHEVSRLRRAGEAFLALMLIPIVAEIATSLLVARMFNTFAPYGIVANAIATPLVSFVLMPAVALFFLLLPFGLEDAALWVMDYGIRAMMWVAHSIHSLPKAQLFVVSPPDWGLALGLGGLLFLCLVSTRVRWLGLGGLALGWLSILTATPPDLLVGTNAKQIALRTDHGYALVRGRTESLVPQLWANGLGLKQFPVLRPGSNAWRCDRFGCIAQVQSQKVAFPHSAEAAMLDCSESRVMLATMRGVNCRNGWVIGPFALERTGVQAFWWEHEGYIRHENGADWQGKRPWSVQ